MVARPADPVAQSQLLSLRVIGTRPRARLPLCVSIGVLCWLSDPLIRLRGAARHRLDGDSNELRRSISECDIEVCTACARLRIGQALHRLPLTDHAASDGVGHFLEPRRCARTEIKCPQISFDTYSSFLLQNELVYYRVVVVMNAGGRDGACEVVWGDPSELDVPGLARQDA